MLKKPYAVTKDFFDWMLSTTELAQNIFPSIDESNISGIEDRTAHIRIHGPLRSGPSFLTFLGIGTEYSNIIKAVENADQNDAIDDIVLDINSPGGDVDGVDLAAIAIRESRKPIRADVSNLAASAAYWLASQADSIVATSPTARFGSIGIFTTVYDDSEFLREYGVKTKTIVATKSPYKNPDAFTEEGEAKIRAVIDDLLEVFVTRVASGRGVTKDAVYSDYGQGDVMIASKALEAGMIDRVFHNLPANNISRDESNRIEGISKPSLNTNREPNRQGVKKMKLEEIKSTYPEIYNEIVESATKTERARVSRLLGWDENEQTRAVVKQAILEGKTQDDILSQLTKASNSQSTELLSMEAENVPDIKPSVTSPTDVNEVDFTKDELVASILRHTK